MVTTVAVQGSDSFESEGNNTSDSGSATTHDNDDAPMPEPTTTQPEGRLPRACRARAPRFFPDNDDVVAPIIRLRPRPRPIPSSPKEAGTLAAL